MIKKRGLKTTRKRDLQSDEETYHLKRKAPSAPASNSAISSIRPPEQTSESNTLVHKYETSGTAQSLHTDTSTRYLDVDIDPNLREGDVLTTDDAGNLPTSTLYTSAKAYTQFINKAPTKVTQENASAIRADRGDYKQGWQIDKEFELAQKQPYLESTTYNERKDDDKWLIDDTPDEKEEEELPFACFICRLDFKDPVVTKCMHYFCESCAIKFHKKSPKCQACGAATGGVFTIAKNLLPMIREREKRMEEEGNAIRAREEALGNTLL